MTEPTREMLAYADWWYRTMEADRVFQAAAEGHDDATDLDDFVDSVATLRTFGPNPLAFEPKVEDPMKVDPYGEAIARIRSALDEAMPLEGGMSHEEFLRLRDMADLLRLRNA